MTSTDLAAQFGGTPVHCQHSTATICARCPVPLHCITTADDAYQFTNAAGVVGFARARYNEWRRSA